jgi:hypothetical protein
MMQILKTKKTRLTPLCLLQAQIGNETERQNAKVRYEERNRAMRKKRRNENKIKERPNLLSG